MRYYLKYKELSGLGSKKKTKWFNTSEDRNKFVTNNGVAILSFGQTAIDLHETEWVKDFKEDCPVGYDEAIELASMFDVFVQIKETNKTGETVWAIESAERPDFWMTARQSKEEAIALCNQMGWIIESITVMEKTHA